MNFLVTSTLDRKYAYPGTLMVDPYTEDRNGHLYLTDASGKHWILCEAIVEIEVDATTPPAAPAQPATRYSDEWLTWAEKHSPSRGERNTANMLREVPFEHRQRAWGLAYSIMNRVATNFSGAMRDAIAELKRANYGETLTERENREWCEQEKARREAKWEAEVRAFHRSVEVTA